MHMGYLFETVPVGDRFVLLVTHDHPHLLYVFRYAHTSKEAADECLKNAQEHFGHPAGIETDLDYNYWRLPPRWTVGDLYKLQFTQRTTQKHTWYILNPLP